MTLTPIQKSIQLHLLDTDSIEHNLRCLVGMLETGEAVQADFLAVGGPGLLHKVLSLQAAIMSGEVA